MPKCVQKNHTYPLPTKFWLREELPKHPDYSIADIRLYLHDVRIMDDHTIFNASEFNIHGGSWIGLHLFLAGERVAHLCAIIELKDFGLSYPSRNEHLRNCRLKGHKPVLIDVPELVESPQMGALVLRPRPYG
jgi:hypothetical protein